MTILRPRLRLLLLHLALASALPSGPLLAPRASVCAAAELQSCPAALPSNFCCPSGTTCQALAGGTTAVCCPAGSTCDKIAPITCDVTAQNPQDDLTVPIKTSIFDVPLAECGADTCCPYGYSCLGGVACQRNADQSSPPSSSGSSGSSSGSSTSSPSRSTATSVLRSSSSSSPSRSQTTGAPTAPTAAARESSAPPADETSLPPPPPPTSAPPPPTSSDPAAPQQTQPPTSPPPPSIPTAAGGSLTPEASPAVTAGSPPGPTSPVSAATGAQPPNPKKISLIGGIIGASAIVLLICIISFLCIRRTRSRQRPASPPGPPTTGSGEKAQQQQQQQHQHQHEQHARKGNISDPIAHQGNTFRTDFILKNRQRTLSLRASLFRKSSSLSNLGTQKPPPVPDMPIPAHIPGSSSSRNNYKNSINSNHHRSSSDNVNYSHLHRTASTSSTIGNSHHRTSSAGSAAAKQPAHASSRLSIPNPFDSSPGGASPTPPTASPDDENRLVHGQVAKARLRPIRGMKVSSSRAVPQSMSTLNREPSSDTINVFADPGVVGWGTGGVGGGGGGGGWRGTHGTTFTDLMDEADLGDVRRGKPYVPRDA